MPFILSEVYINLYIVYIGYPCCRYLRVNPNVDVTYSVASRWLKICLRSHIQMLSCDNVFVAWHVAVDMCGLVLFSWGKYPASNQEWVFGLTNSLLSTAEVPIDAVVRDCLESVNCDYCMHVPDLESWVNSFSSRNFKPSLSDHS